MLRRLLQLIARTGTARSTELARALDVSTALVEPMLEELTRRGYLRVLARGGARRCERCPVRATCLRGNSARILGLTAKGSCSVRIRAGPSADR